MIHDNSRFAMSRRAAPKAAGAAGPAGSADPWGSAACPPPRCRGSRSAASTPPTGTPCADGGATPHDAAAEAHAVGETVSGDSVDDLRGRLRRASEVHHPDRNRILARMTQERARTAGIDRARRYGWGRAPSRTALAVLAALSVAVVAALAVTTAVRGRRSAG